MLALLACSSDKGEKEKALATVNGSPITITELLHEVEGFGKVNPVSNQTVDERRQRLMLDDQLQQMIEHKLLIQEVVKLGLNEDRKFVQTIKVFWEQTIIRNLIEDKNAQLSSMSSVTNQEIANEYERMKSSPSIHAMRGAITENDADEVVRQMRGVKQLIGEEVIGSANDLGTTMFSKAAGIQLTYVPFSGTGAAIPALLGGHVTALMAFSPMGVQYGGKFRALAIASEKRMEVLPDVPTFKEQGYDIVEGTYRGVAAPAGTPYEIIKILADAFDKAMKDPEVRKKMDQNGFKMEFMGPEASLALVKKMVEYEAILKELGRIKK